MITPTIPPFIYSQDDVRPEDAGSSVGETVVSNEKPMRKIPEDLLH
jgi:hypothetical protein